MENRSRRRVAIVSTLALLAFGAVVVGQGQGQGPAAPPTEPVKGTGLVAGQVVDAVTGRPVPGVTVSIGGGGPATFTYTVSAAGGAQIGGPGRSVAPPGAPRLLLSDGNGRFVFHDLVKGHYILRTNAAGYLMGGSGQNRPNGPAQPFDLAADDSKIGDLTIRMWKTAVIAGTVTDEAGDPIVSIPVYALRRTLTNGQVRFASTGSGGTDDRGVYRISGLAPSDYVVVVTSSQTTVPAATADAYAQVMSTPNGSATSQLYQDLSSSGAPYIGMGGTRVGDLITVGTLGQPGATPPPPADDGRMLIYPTTFAPSATSAAMATVVKLASGQDRSAVDLQLKLVPALRVSGTVIGPSGPMPNTAVRLQTPDSDAIAGFFQNTDAATTVTDGTGAFTFLGVTPGQYTLKVARVPRPPASNMMPANMTTIEVSGPGGMTMMGVSSVGPGAVAPPPPPIPTDPTLSATVPISVGDTDVAGVAVVLRPGVRLSGRLQFDGSREPPTPQQLQRANISFTTTEVRRFNATPQVRIETDGTFTTGGFVPGRYQITASVNIPAPPGTGLPANSQAWTFKSATADGHNLADDPLDVGDHDVAGIVITFTDRTTQITGAVVDAKGQIDKAAEVIIFPADSQSWRQGLPNTRRIRAARASLIGVYEFTGLAAGDYFIAAVSGTTAVDLQDPKFLDALVSVATRITLSDGEKKTQDMAVKPVAPR